MHVSWKGLEVKEGLPSCSACVQLARINQGNKLEEKLAKFSEGATLTLPVGFWTNKFLKTKPTADEFLFFDSIDLRSSRLCSWGFEALVFSSSSSRDRTLEEFHGLMLISGHIIVGIGLEGDVDRDDVTKVLLGDNEASWP
ncbi:hypothetical protein M9H77_29873 [Catharanthus roseus]|uniref:Uncharacterized protein n=1 Tax=Catharanthus roseus TaxID=4058 RepID=A0ACB9ZWJ8_CATRO|nr:hypothetical protein M9H77_29873 [Catharanthus roseus]